MEESNDLKLKGKFDEAIEKLKDAIDLARSKIRDTDERLKEVEKIKSKMDYVYLAKAQSKEKEAANFKSQEKYDQTLDLYKEALQILENVKEEHIKEKESVIINKKIDFLKLKKEVENAKDLSTQGAFDEAITTYKNALEVIISSEELEAQEKDQETQGLKKKINSTYKAKIENQIERANSLEEKGDIQEALEIVNESLKLTEEMYDFDDKKIEQAKLKGFIDKLYSKKIKNKISTANKLLSEDKKDQALEELIQGLDLKESLYNTEDRENLTQEIGNILNPLILEKVKPLVEQGNKLAEKEDFEEDTITINKAVRLYREAYDLVNKMADSNEKKAKLKELSEIINQTCMRGINPRKIKGVQLIDELKLEEAISELYSALSIAKNMISEIKGEHFESQAIKDLVNKVYSAEIYDILEEASKETATQNYDSALDKYEEALKVTNKMYLSEDMENEEKKIKNLIKQTEVKKYIAEGNLLVQQKQFGEEIEKLKQELEEASKIEDDELRYKKINQVKQLINEVHVKEINLIIEQAVQHADQQEFESSFQEYETALENVSLIEDNEELQENTTSKIKQSYVEALNSKAKFDISHENYDAAIQATQKALNLTENIESHYKMAIAFSYKGEYENAIDQYNKTLEKEPENPETWKNLGLAYKYQNAYDKALDSFNKAISLKQDYALVYYHMANTYRMMGEAQNAMEMYQKTISIDPKYVNAWLFLGYTQFEVKQYDEAIESMEKALELNPELKGELSELISNYKKIKRDIVGKLSNLFQDKPIKF